MESARQQLGAIVGRLVPRPVGVDTAEGMLFSACIEGMLTGHHELGLSDTQSADAQSTDITNPGVLDLVHRECERLIGHATYDLTHGTVQ